MQVKLTEEIIIPEAPRATPAPRPPPIPPFNFAFER